MAEAIVVRDLTGCYKKIEFIRSRKPMLDTNSKVVRFAIDYLYRHMYEDELQNDNITRVHGKKKNWH